jgi:hypothetical protein
MCRKMSGCRSNSRLALEAPNLIGRRLATDLGAARDFVSKTKLLERTANVYQSLNCLAPR